MTKKFIIILIIGLTTGALLYADEASYRLRLAIAQQQFSWDPQAITNEEQYLLFSAVYQGLVRLDANSLQPLPAWAQSWQISEDKLEYRFNIRPRARFSDGSAITAQSFYRSMLRLLDPRSNNPNAELLYIVQNAKEYSTGELSDVKQLGIVVENDQTLVLKLAYPAPYIFEILAHPALAPLSGSQLPLKWSDPRSIAFSGPYLYASSSDEGFILRRNRLYWEADKVEIATIVVSAFEDVSEVNQAVRAGGVDWAHNFFNQRVSMGNTHRILATPRYASQYYLFLADEGPYAQEEVRRALIMLLPLRVLRDSGLPPAETLLPPTIDYPEVQGVINSDYSEGMFLLGLAGYPDAEGLPPIKILSFMENDPRVFLMQEAWQKAGIEVVVVQAKERENYYQEAITEQATLMEYGWSAEFLDPLAFLFKWQSHSRYNIANFEDAEFDQIIMQSHHLIGTERLEQLALAEEIILTRGAVIPMNFLVDLDVVDLRRLQGFGQNPLGRQLFERLTKQVRFTYYNAA